MRRLAYKHIHTLCFVNAGVCCVFHAYCSGKYSCIIQFVRKICSSSITMRVTDIGHRTQTILPKEPAPGLRLLKCYIGVRSGKSSRSRLMKCGRKKSQQDLHPLFEARTVGICLPNLSQVPNDFTAGRATSPVDTQAARSPFIQLGRKCE